MTPPTIRVIYISIKLLRQKYIIKMDKTSETTLLQRFANGQKHMKRCSTSLAPEKCKLKPQWKTTSHPLGRLSSKSQILTHVGEDTNKSESSYNAVKWKLLSRVRLFVTPWTVVYHTHPSMGFSRQGYWSGLPFPSPEDLPDPGIEPGSPALYADALPSEPPGKSNIIGQLLWKTVWQTLE